MVKGKMLGLVLVFVAITIVATIFIVNLSEMNVSYSENTTHAEIGERSFKLFELMYSLIIPIAILLGLVLIFLMLKWTFKQGGGKY